MLYESLQEDLAKQQMKVTLYGPDPRLRYQTGWSWFLTEEQCAQEILHVELGIDSTVSETRMCEGIVARHAPQFKLIREQHSNSFGSWLVFVRR